MSKRYVVVAGFNTPFRRCLPDQVVTEVDLTGDPLSIETRVARKELREAPADDAPAAAAPPPATPADTLDDDR